MDFRQAILLLGVLVLRPRALAGGPDVPGPAPGWVMRAWQTDEGLPDNDVTGVAQTSEGFLWVATLGGLLRFDGARFEEFSTVQLPGVPNRVVRNMYLDR